METTDKCVQGESTFKHQYHCHVTLRYNTEKKRRKKTGKLIENKHVKRSEPLQLWKRDNIFIKSVSAELHSSPPTRRHAKHLKPTICGFLLVQADSIASFRLVHSCPIPQTSLSPIPLCFPYICEGRRGRSSCVTVCAE